MSGFGIYVHWPFCSAKCPYCDFNSHVRSHIDEDGWLDAIVRELEWVAERQGGERPIVETVFFGGGTPSLMQGASVQRVLDTVARLWRMANDVEVTLESNPASADAARFRDYRYTMTKVDEDHMHIVVELKKDGKYEKWSDTQYERKSRESKTEVQ